jgi:hypothetical protein
MTGDKISMTSFTRSPLDFIVTREDWCRYDLSDNSILKVKVILTKVYKNLGQLMCEIHPIHVILTNEKGDPDPKKYSTEELIASINKDIKFTTVIEDCNEYVVDDGTTIKIRPLVLKIAKTSKFDSKGFPKYICEIRGNMDMEPPVS